MASRQPAGCALPHICDLGHKLRYDGSHTNSRLARDTESASYERLWGSQQSQAGSDRPHSLRGLPGDCDDGFVSPKAGILLPGLVATADLVLIGIYLTVASILAWVVSIARCAKERAYFVLCASSATFGLLRTVFGDGALPAAQYLRVIMLSLAVLVGTWIFRSFSSPVTEDVLSD